MLTQIKALYQFSYQSTPKNTKAKKDKSVYRLFRKRLQIVEPTKTDVLIFDDLGSNWLHHCLPSGITRVTISLRHSFPVVLNFRFFFNVLKTLIREMRGRREDGSYALLCGLIKNVSPRVIISCLDNSHLLTRFDKDHPQIKVAFIQTALRDTVQSFSPKFLSALRYAKGHAGCTIS